MFRGGCIFFGFWVGGLVGACFGQVADLGRAYMLEFLVFFTI